MRAPSRNEVDEGPGETRAGALPAERAFVVHVRADADVAAGRLCGRVEHVVSGRTRHCASLEDLVDFVREVIAELPGPRGRER